jgi:peptide methionine sulfoxide reductase msrA/msrB
MMKEIYLAGGCFWGTEHYLKQIRGVVSTEVGYANGRGENPTYEQVYTDATGFVECVKVVYNSELLSLERLVEIYFNSIDPLSLNRQGNDVGTRYRTGIYYTDEGDRAAIEGVYGAVESRVGAELVVELEPLSNFYNAEEYHQDYLDKNPNGYCHLPAFLFQYAKKANN